MPMPGDRDVDHSARVNQAYSLQKTISEGILPSGVLKNNIKWRGGCVDGVCWRAGAGEEKGGDRTRCRLEAP